jgi:hypothetical protein
VTAVFPFLFFVMKMLEHRDSLRTGAQLDLKTNLFLAVRKLLRQIIMSEDLAVFEEFSVVNKFVEYIVEYVWVAHVTFPQR